METSKLKKINNIKIEAVTKKPLILHLCDTVDFVPKTYLEYTELR